MRSSYLILTRMLNAPQELSFQAWTSPEHIPQWMQPEPGMVESRDNHARGWGRIVESLARFLEQE